MKLRSMKRWLMILTMLSIFVFGCKLQREEIKIDAQYEPYINKQCSDDKDCGPFPCIEKTCLVKRCSSDIECPNGLCGLNASPTPGYCTNVDIT